jgi:DNA-binding HxlR family transcriptional regulator
MISGKYKLRILWDLRDGPLRYGQIRKGLLRGLTGSPEISPRVLSRELKSLGDMGMLNRKDFLVKPLKVAYSLTPKGRSLLPTISRIHAWGAMHMTDSR